MLATGCSKDDDNDSNNNNTVVTHPDSVNVTFVTTFVNMTDKEIATVTYRDGKDTVRFDDGVYWLEQKGHNTYTQKFRWLKGDAVIYYFRTFHAYGYSSENLSVVSDTSFSESVMKKDTIIYHTLYLN